MNSSFLSSLRCCSSVFALLRASSPFLIHWRSPSLLSFQSHMHHSHQCFFFLLLIFHFSNFPDSLFSQVCVFVCDCVFQYRFISPCLTCIFTVSSFFGSKLCLLVFHVGFREILYGCVCVCVCSLLNPIHLSTTHTHVHAHTHDSTTTDNYLNAHMFNCGISNSQSTK